MTAERHNSPAQAVMTDRFISAAELMSRVLGMPGYEFMVIPHPVSSADDAALCNMAAATAARMAQMLVRR